MECTICIDAISADEKPIKFECGHAFHSTCASKWLLFNNTCPYCRNEIYKETHSVDIDDEELKVTLIDNTIFKMYNETLLENFYLELDEIVEDIDSEYFRDWMYDSSQKIFDIKICIKSKRGHIWTHFTYLPESKNLFVYFDEYKVYEDIANHPEYLYRYFKLDTTKNILANDTSLHRVL